MEVGVCLGRQVARRAMVMFSQVSVCPTKGDLPWEGGEGSALGGRWGSALGGRLGSALGGRWGLPWEGGGGLPWEGGGSALGGRFPPGEYGQWPGGTHPTPMHTC